MQSPFVNNDIFDVAFDIDNNNIGKVYIVHQCNCVSTGVKGMAWQMFNKFPDAHHKNKKRILGTIDIVDNQGKFGNISVVNFYAQQYPGKADDRKLNDRQSRIEAFYSCMNSLYEHIKKEHKNEGVTILLPYGIGCGLAGGWWREYDALINIFSSMLQDINISQFYDVIVCRKPQKNFSEQYQKCRDGEVYAKCEDCGKQYLLVDIAQIAIHPRCIQCQINWRMLEPN